MDYDYHQVAYSIDTDPIGVMLTSCYFGLQKIRHDNITVFSKTISLSSMHVMQCTKRSKWHLQCCFPMICIPEATEVGLGNIVDDLVLSSMIS